MATRLPKLEEAFPVTIDTEGRKLCRWDQAVIPKGRRTFCGKRSCIHEVSMRTNPDYLRRLVFKRDKGICVECGCDTGKVRRLVFHAVSSYQEVGAALGHRATYFMWAHESVWAVFVAMGFNRNYDAAEWEADHVTEVIRGGDSCLDNMQTLCVPCHKVKTKQLAADRARERRDAKRQLFDTEPSPELSLTT